MLTKIIIILSLVFIVYSLGTGLYYLLQDRGQSTRLVKALSWRIGLSFVLFIFLILAAYLGWIVPQPTP